MLHNRNNPAPLPGPSTALQNSWSRGNKCVLVHSCMCCPQITERVIKRSAYLRSGSVADRVPSAENCTERKTRDTIISRELLSSVCKSWNLGGVNFASTLTETWNYFTFFSFILKAKVGNWCKASEDEHFYFRAANLLIRAWAVNHFKGVSSMFGPVVTLGYSHTLTSLFTYLWTAYKQESELILKFSCVLK